MVLRVTTNKTQTNNIQRRHYPSHYESGFGEKISHAVNKGGIIMTANQIAYWNLEENKRKNRANERETTRHNHQAESIQQSEARTKRLAHEENARHNVQTELIQNRDATTRRQANYENVRHNQAVEAETHAQNIRSTSQGWGKITADLGGQVIKGLIKAFA